MTVGSLNRRTGALACNGSVVDFAFTFKVQGDAELDVYLHNVAADSYTLLTLTTHYTVARNADQDSNPGGTVTTVATYASGNNIILISDVSRLQGTDLQNLGGYYPQVIEERMDALAIGLQEDADRIGRSLRVPIYEAALPPLPGGPARANMVITFDANGDLDLSDASVFARVSGTTFTGVIGLSGLAPAILITETDAAANEKKWRFGLTNNGDLNVQTFNDAETVAVNALKITRTGTVVDSIVFGADISVPDEVYGAAWNASLEAPTKSAVYDAMPYINVDDYAAGDGTTDDTTAITSADTAAAAQGKPLIFDGAKTYAIASLVTPAAGSTWITNGCTFKKTASSSLGPIVASNSKFTFDMIRVSIPTAVVVARPVVIGGTGCRGGNIEVISVDFQSSTDADGGVKFSGNDISVGNITVDNHEASVYVDATNGLTAGLITSIRSAKGVFLKDSFDIDIRSVRLENSINSADASSGNNVVLVKNTDRVSIGSVFDGGVGEHTVRIGEASDDIHFGVIYGQPGKTVLKSRPAHGTVNRRIYVGAVIGVDAGSGTIGANENVLMLERSEDVHVGAVVGTKEATANSAWAGVFISGCNHVTVDNMDIETPARAALEIQAANADDLAAPVVLSSSHINVSGVANMTSGVAGVIIECETGATFGPISVRMRITGSATPVVVNNAGGTLTGPIFLDIDTDTTPILSGTGSGSSVIKQVSTATQTALDLKANLAGATFTGPVGVSGNAPAMIITETDAAVDEKKWNFGLANGGNLKIQTLNDAGAGAVDAITIFRTGTALDGISFGAKAGLKPYTVAGLPAVGSAGFMIFVTNEAGGAVPAFSDGTNWRRVTDRLIVS